MPDDAASVPSLHPHHTVLILRLTLDPQHQLYQGTVVDLAEQVIGQFRDWQELATLLQHYWRTQSAGAPNRPHDE